LSNSIDIGLLCFGSANCADFDKNNWASSHPHCEDAQGIIEHSVYHEWMPYHWSYSLSVGGGRKIVMHHLSRRHSIRYGYTFKICPNLGFFFLSFFCI
jgi:hypothetical protein